MKTYELDEPGTIFGFFDDPSQAKPTFDPGLGALCPFCLIAVGGEKIRTTSLMPVGGDRSYFYRAHILCLDTASKDEVTFIESLVIDMVSDD